MNRTHRRRLPNAALAVLLCTAVLAACGDDGDDGDERGPSAGMAEEWSVLSALAQVPAAAAGDSVYLQTADLDAVTELSGVARPTDPADTDALVAWLNSFTGGPSEPQAVVFAPLAESFNSSYAVQAGEFADILGWSIVDVTSYVEQAVPPKQFAVVAGVEGKLSPDLADVGDGIVTDIETDDLTTDLQQRSAVTPLGRPSRLAEQDGLVAMSTTTQAVRGWLGDGETLADDEGLAQVARALDDEDVVSAVVASVEPGGNPAVRALGSAATPELLEQLGDEIDAMLPAEPYDAVGIGWSVDDGTSEVHVVYHFMAEAGAEPGAKVLESAWRDGTSIVTRAPYAEHVSVDEVDVEGAVVTVTLHVVGDGRLQVPLQMFQQREPVFLPR